MILPRYLVGTSSPSTGGSEPNPEVIDVYISGGCTAWCSSPVDINDVDCHKKTQPARDCSPECRGSRNLSASAFPRSRLGCRPIIHHRSASRKRCQFTDSTDAVRALSAELEEVDTHLKTITLNARAVDDTDVHFVVVPVEIPNRRSVGEVVGLGRGVPVRSVRGRPALIE